MPEIERKANKGEWSEFYVFLKILENKELPAADKNLEIVQGKNFIFHKIIRDERESTKTYDISQPGTRVIIADEDGRTIKEYDTVNLGQKTLRILDQIKTERSRSFSIPEAQQLMSDLMCTEIKAGAQRKADLVGIIEDRVTKTNPMLGFSIKSMLGGASTLLNPGTTTNFVYRISGFSGSVDEINSIETNAYLRDRIHTIVQKGGKFIFDKVVSDQFDMNLKMIDTALPELVANMLLDFFISGRRTVTELADELGNNREFVEKYGLERVNSKYFEYKIKNMLDAVALGMVPSRPWDGFSKAHGGYIVVKKDGVVVCYHLYNRDEFRSYLYENTKFDAASATRYGYGKIYEDNGRLLFNLNLQIRFTR